MEELDADLRIHINHRKHPRYRVRLPITINLGRRWVEARAADVSENGLFIEADILTVERRLMRFRVPIPSLGRELLAHGMVVHNVPSHNPLGRGPGFGVKLFAIDRSARLLWEAYLAYARENSLDEEIEILFDEPLILDS